jgi:hypothetical protein
LGLEDVLDALTTATVAHTATAVERRIALRTLVTMARAQSDPATPIDVAAILRQRLDKATASLGKAGDDGWGTAVAAMLKDPRALGAEIGKLGRPAPAIPPGMPIGGDTGWFDGN